MREPRCEVLPVVVQADLQAELELWAGAHQIPLAKKAGLQLCVLTSWSEAGFVSGVQFGVSSWGDRAIRLQQVANLPLWSSYKGRWRSRAVKANPEEMPCFGKRHSYY